MNRTGRTVVQKYLVRIKQSEYPLTKIHKGTAIAGLGTHASVRMRLERPGPAIAGNAQAIETSARCHPMRYLPERLYLT